MLELPNNLRNIRKKHQNPELRSGEKIADLMGISKQYYYDLETGRNHCRLNIDHINKLIKIFKVSAGEIVLPDSIKIINPDYDQNKLMRIINDDENEPFILLGVKAKEKGMPIDVLEKLIEFYTPK